MAPRKPTRWSLRALLAWCYRCVLVVGIASAFLVGQQITDTAWDRGLHVTPTQAALHFALEARGIAHHHEQARPAPSTPVQSGGPILQQGSGGLTIETPLGPADVQVLLTLLLVAVGALYVSGSRRKSDYLSSPLAPPPKTP